MANMSYCRFENTAQDLSDCINALDEALEQGQSWQEFYDNLSSNHERRAVQHLLDYCRDFISRCDELQE